MPRTKAEEDQVDSPATLDDIYELLEDIYKPIRSINFAVQVIGVIALLMVVLAGCSVIVSLGLI